jgi:hypothetical protein
MQEILMAIAGNAPVLKILKLTNGEGGVKSNTFSGLESFGDWGNTCRTLCPMRISFFEFVFKL